MDLYEKIRTLPTQPGVYLYKNPEGEVIYVGKAKNLRSRVRSYLLAASQANAKTGSLMREAVDLDYILVANEHEALALENNLIKQRKPRFNILLRDDKTYPYVKLTLADRFPKVFVTRRLRKDGSAYYGPYFPGNLAYRVVELIHRSFLIPSCKVDLSRYHPRACLQYYIHRCMGPCVEGLTTPEAYRVAVRDAQLFLEGRHAELERTLEKRMMAAAQAEQFEAAARLRDQLSTVRQLQEKQRIATAEQSDDADVFGYHYEDGSLAVNLFHMRAGKIVDRREFFWEDLETLMEDREQGNEETREQESTNIGAPGPSPLETGEATGVFNPGTVFSALLKQLYIDQQYVPRSILVPTDFDDREALAALLAERTGHKVELAVPQRGEKRSLVDLAGQNAKQSFTQRFRVLEPSRKAIQETLADLLMLPELPRRIECFDISHIQGAETVASLVVWEDGKMNKSAYRKFKVMTVLGVDDFASMREVVHRRYRRILENGNGNKPGDPEAGALSHKHPAETGLVTGHGFSRAESAGGAMDVSPALQRGERGESNAEPRRGDAALKGHGFSRAEIDGEISRALAPEGRSSSKEPKTMPSLILIDGGLGQLHAAAEALESLGLTSQPLASIAKKEELIYLYGNEDEPIVLDRRSPVLHLIQMIRDESHRFAVGYHRQRRAMRDRDSELLSIPGVGPQTRQRLLTHFGSLRDVQQATAESLASVVPRRTADTIWRHFHQEPSTP